MRKHTLSLLLLSSVTSIGQSTEYGISYSYGLINGYEYSNSSSQESLEDYGASQPSVMNKVSLTLGYSHYPIRSRQTAFNLRRFSLEFSSISTKFNDSLGFIFSDPNGGGIVRRSKKVIGSTSLVGAASWNPTFTTRVLRKRDTELHFYVAGRAAIEWRYAHYYRFTRASNTNVEETESTQNYETLGTALGVSPGLEYRYFWNSRNAFFLGASVPMGLNNLFWLNQNEYKTLEPYGSFSLRAGVYL